MTLAVPLPFRGSGDGRPRPIDGAGHEVRGGGGWKAYEGDRVFRRVRHKVNLTDEEGSRLIRNVEIVGSGVGDATVLPDRLRDARHLATAAPPSRIDAPKPLSRVDAMPCNAADEGQPPQAAGRNQALRAVRSLSRTLMERTSVQRTSASASPSRAASMPSASPPSASRPAMWARRDPARESMVRQHFHLARESK